MGILISAGYGWAIGSDAKKLFRNPFCSETHRFTDEAHDTQTIIIPEIIRGTPIEDIRTTLKNSGHLIIADSTKKVGEEKKVSTDQGGDKQADADSEDVKEKEVLTDQGGDKKGDGPAVAKLNADSKDGNEKDISTDQGDANKNDSGEVEDSNDESKEDEREFTSLPPAEPPKPLNLAGKKYGWEHVKHVLEKYATKVWPGFDDDDFDIITFGEYMKREFQGVETKMIKGCTNFMLDKEVIGQYESLQKKYNQYLLDVKRHQKLLEDYESTTVRIKSDTTPCSYTKRQYSKAVQDKYLDVIEDGNRRKNKDGKQTMLHISSINDFQRFGPIEDSKHKLVNKACTLLTQYQYTPKTKETDPNHRRGLNVVQPHMGSDPSKLNWVMKSKHTESSLKQFVGIRSLYPFGSDAPEECFTANSHFKMNYQPINQVDCPKYLMNTPPANGGPPIDYLLDSCVMTEIKSSRDGSTCEDHNEKSCGSCGKSLAEGDLVIIWGEDAHRVRGDTIFNGVWTLDYKTLEIICRVGVVKFLPHQCEYFQNRIGCVSDIILDNKELDDVKLEENTNDNADSDISEDDNGVTFVKKVEGRTTRKRKVTIKKEAIKKEVKGGKKARNESKKKEDDGKKKKATVDDKFVDACNGYATIVFTDGTVKVNTTGRVVSRLI